MTFAAALVDGVSLLVNGCSDLGDVTLVTDNDGSSTLVDASSELFATSSSGVAEDPVVREDRVFVAENSTPVSTNICDEACIAEVVALLKLVGDSEGLSSDELRSSGDLTSVIVM